MRFSHFTGFVCLRLQTAPTEGWLMSRAFNSPECGRTESSQRDWWAVSFVTAFTAVGLLIILILPASHICTAAAQQAEAPAPYDDQDAYEIYNLLIPHEESYGFGKGTIVIREETFPGPADSGSCFSDKAATKFKEAIDDFKRVNNAKRWRLQRLFQIERPYEIVSAEEMEGAFHTKGVQGGWEDFNARHPDSGGYFVMSAVGFNRDKTLAVVYTGSSCGGLCGRSSFHLLQKVDGKWKTLPGVQCVTVS
jgi:hypothetical protein